MLKDWIKGEKPGDEEMTARLQKAREQLNGMQMAIKEKKLPVLVIFDGWGGAGKGSVMGKVIKNLDPRFYKTETLSKPSEDELRKPFLYRYFVRIPEAGKFSFFDGSWMDEVTKNKLSGKINGEDYHRQLISIKRFERQLSDNGYLVVKFFFHISKSEQKQRLKDLADSKSTAWRVEKWDLWQNKHYDKCVDVYDEYLEATNQFIAPWYFVDSKNRKWAELQVTELLVKSIEIALQNTGHAAAVLQNTFPLKQMPKLADIALDKKISDEKYDSELKELQSKLADLHNRIYHAKIPVVVAYEGWDAAGKGGNIKRLTAALDPRGFEVHPIASPEPHEKNRHYLWRFWTRLPKDGHIAIFDRTWYGRVMVERLEGFCSENDWQRAYNEINEFEKELDDWGAVIVKFWVQIDKDTQLARFTDRQNTPEKQWKITDEDWRNREKWDLYETAVNEMIQKTSTEYAPWHILESNDKHYARIKALKTVTDEIEKKLKK
ncbi:MAG TPA: polyphosphate:AMP phosphotransferase [Lachnospiraceae bacterium]|nr:polyphosphate:AMP phosphotransferase [Lachnospiraceae bacterium]MBQ2452860.1 polyphosphate:AMP phosphotransferase [Lachnospiraceae bacterium]MBQ4242702.1 polyphosphate:AMP phosphotransferase [Lachnospiraceae bacterium]MBQ9568155.1 polyphosphate:AMP phosphotransferase [Lachnospiraceae bacterium]HBB59406.1 polyphosphate:AMP phosphotransferase [Lachnospiraceae bacterium]